MHFLYYWHQCNLVKFDKRASFWIKYIVLLCFFTGCRRSSSSAQILSQPTRDYQFVQTRPIVQMRTRTFPGQDGIYESVWLKSSYSEELERVMSLPFLQQCDGSKLSRVDHINLLNMNEWAWNPLQTSCGQPTTNKSKMSSNLRLESLPSFPTPSAPIPLLIYLHQSVLLKEHIVPAPCWHPHSTPTLARRSIVYIWLEMVLQLPRIALPTAISYRSDRGGKYIILTIFWHQIFYAL